MKFALNYAITNATRLWRETLPLVLLAVIIAATLTTSAAYAEYSDEMYKSIADRYEVAVELFYSPIYSITGQTLSERTDVTYGMVKEMAVDENVRKACFSYQYMRDIPWVWQVNFDADTADDTMWLYGIDAQSFAFVGVTDSYYSNASNIVEGRKILDEEGADYGKKVVLISNVAAEHESVTVGDTISIYGPIIKDGILSETYEIVGIYDSGDPEKYGAMYIPLSVIELMGETSDDHEVSGTAGAGVYFIMKEPDETVAFVERSIEWIGEQPFALEANDYAYKREAAPAATARDLNNTINILAVVVGVILTFILGVILARLRRREMLTLYMIGCTRTFVTVSYTFEKLIITLFGTVIGCITGVIMTGILTGDVGSVTGIDIGATVVSLILPIITITILSAIAAVAAVNSKSREVLANDK